MSDLRLTVLGCSGSYPAAGGACSGYLVEAAGQTIAVDLGSGCLANLQRHVALDGLDAVVLSHSHPDHWMDLTGLEVAWKYALGRRGLRVYGTAETRQKATAVMAELTETFDWVDVADGDTVHIGGETGVQASFSATEHYVATLAVRLSTNGGPALAYSADTGPGWSFAEFGRSVALGLCEATFLADREDEGVLHLSARQAGEMARAAGVERLVLTHFQPGVDRAAAGAEGEAAFGATVAVAAEHQTHDL